MQRHTWEYIGGGCRSAVQAVISLAVETARESPFLTIWSRVDDDGAMGLEGWASGNGSHMLLYSAEFFGGVVASVTTTLVFLLDDLRVFTILELKRKLENEVLSLGFYFHSIE